MRLTKYLIDIDLLCETGEHLLANGSNGLIDVIDATEYSVFSSWKEKNIIKNCDIIENEKLFLQMVKRGYIVGEDYNEETERIRFIKSLEQKNLKKMNAVRNVCIIPSYNCNFACPYCYESNIVSSKLITKDQIDDIFEIYKDGIDHISFFGGEPLLLGHKQIIKYVISKAPNVVYSAITNGYYLEEYFEIFSTLNISNIQVTLDGTESTHNSTRRLKNGNGTFVKILQGVKLYAENNIPITIRMNVTPDNMQSCFELKKFISSEEWAKNLKFEMQAVFQLNSNLKNELTDKMLDDDFRSLRKNEILRRQGPLGNFLFNNTPLKPIVKGCSADMLCRYFDPEGNVYSCILAIGNPNKRIGVYGGHSGEIKFDQSSMLMRSVLSVPECRECSYALFCGGGCANAIPDNLDITKTPNCQGFLSHIKNEIPVIYKLKHMKL